MKPKISIILPFYNAENTLEKAIQSISGQTFRDFECILINNNSTDNSLQIASSWIKRDSRFVLIHETKQGVVYASNKGASVAKGEYIARMDADDFAYPEKLELQKEYLDNHPDVGVISGLAHYSGQLPDKKGFKKYVNWVNSVQSYQEIRIKRFIDSPVVNPTAMWRKKIGDQYGLYKAGNFPEDYEMWLRWLEKGICIEKINKYLLRWVDSDSRLTRTHDIYSDEAFYSIKTYYLARWLKKYNPFHPHLMVWGASKTSRKRAKMLERNGAQIDAYIDTNKNRQIEKKLIYYQEIPEPEKIFILVYVRQWYAKDEINNYLSEKGFIEGRDYLFVS